MKDKCNFKEKVLISFSSVVVTHLIELCTVPLGGASMHVYCPIIPHICLPVSTHDVCNFSAQHACMETGNVFVVIDRPTWKDQLKSTFK